MKKVFKGDSREVIEEIKQWIEDEVIEYDFIDVIVELIKPDKTL